MAKQDALRRALDAGGIDRLRATVQTLVDSGTDADVLGDDLARLAETVEDEGDEQLADLVRDVGAMCAGWSSPDSAIRRQRTGTAKGTVVSVYGRVVNVPTTSAVWTDRNWATQMRERLFPMTASDQPSVLVLNLIGVLATPAVLEELLLPVAMGIRAGAYGPLSLTVYTHDRATASYVEYLASRFEVPLFVGLVKRWLDVPEVWPAGELTSSEKETLDVLAGNDGAATASQLGQRVSISSTAAGNRLARLSDKSWVFRFRGSGSAGDVFVDPRVGAPNIRDLGLHAQTIKHIDVAPQSSSSARSTETGTAEQGSRRWLQTADVDPHPPARASVGRATRHR